MDDKFLHDARRDPRPEFAARLRESLGRQGTPRPAWRPARLTWRLAPALAAAAAVIGGVLLFTFPSVRASAQAFLDLFRVRNFAAVEIDPSRLDRLRELNTTTGRDPALLVFDKQEVLRDPGQPQLFTDPHAAGQAAGIAVRVPTQLPYGLRSDTVSVQGEAEARLSVDIAKLREIMASLGITDVSVPDELDGAKVTFHAFPVVGIRYRTDRERVDLVQARSPEVTLPPGVDLAQLGEVGLRIIGLSPAEARRLAQSIDWHSTVLVPVPANASSFREVSVQGNKGLLVTTTGDPVGRGAKRRRGSLLLWSEGDMVYALSGTIDSVSLVEMANSLR